MPAAKYASRNIVETNTTEYTFHIIIVKIGFPCHFERKEKSFFRFGV